MGRPEKPINVLDGPTERFASELRKLRRNAGNPTYREMARCALYSPSILSSAASGNRLPTLQVTLAYVQACGGDIDEWRKRWSEVQRVEPEPASSVAEPNVPTGELPCPPAQLPLCSHTFTGRREELQWLTVNGSSGRPVVITGPAGIGKSELAFAYAQNIAQDKTDGHLYANFDDNALRSDGSDAVIDDFLLALGIPSWRLTAAADQKAGLYRSVLAHRKILVVLDNVCDERQVRPLLAISQSSVTIITSRASLSGLNGVRQLRLDVLPRADSTAHIASVLPSRAQKDPVACDQLAALCADLPLAIDIATRKLASCPGLSLRCAVDKLARPGIILDWLKIGDLSIRDTLGKSYWGLDEAARVLLHSLAARIGTPSIQGFAQRPVIAPPEEEDLYAHLVEAGMLRTADFPGTYHANPLAMAFANKMNESARPDETNER